jgi:hypothetical protein
MRHNVFMNFGCARVRMNNNAWGVSHVPCERAPPICHVCHVRHVCHVAYDKCAICASAMCRVA